MWLMENGELLDCEAVLVDGAHGCEHCWSTLSTEISSKRQSMRLMEGGELFLETNCFKAEHAERVEFGCMVDTDSLLDTGSKLLLNSN